MFFRFHSLASADVGSALADRLFVALHGDTITGSLNTRRVKRTPHGLIIVMVLAAMAGCGQKHDMPVRTGQFSVKQLKIGYFPNVTHAQAVLGLGQGDFTNAFPAVEIIPRQFNAGPELITALNAGEVDIAYVGPGPAINSFMKSRGKSIRVIAGAAANGVVIVARKGAGITSLADLAGKNLATPQLGNTQDISAKHYLRDVLHVSTDNVQVTPNAQLLAGFDRGRLDAAWVPEPWGSRLLATGNVTLIGEEKDLWPQQRFVLTVVVTTPSFLQDHPDVVEKFLAVHEQLTQQLQNRPAEQSAKALADSLASLTGEKIPPAIVRQALGRTQFTDDPLPATFTAMAQWSYQLQFIDTKPNLDGLFATDVLRKITALPPTTRP